MAPHIFSGPFDPSKKDRNIAVNLVNNLKFALRKMSLTKYFRNFELLASSLSDTPDGVSRNTNGKKFDFVRH